MAVAAVPKYLGSKFNDAFPGMRFGLLLELWGEDRRSDKLLWQTENSLIEPRNKKGALYKAAKLNKVAKALSIALEVRQKAMIEYLDEAARLSIYAKSTSPFITGLGNEYLLENGFSFLNPYALPYLPGSGVKGVLRQAAQELSDGTWGDKKGWSNDVIEQLFGPETHQSGDSKESLRKGMLSFWDVFPQVPQDKLDVEVMIPHQTHYYQGKEPPYDSEQPSPIVFLAVPPKSKFAFHVTCDLKRIDSDLANEGQWQKLVETAFNHAFEWVGFGAKTAVGYGAMTLDEEEVKRRAKQKEEKKKIDEIKSATKGKPDDVSWILHREGRWSERSIFLDDMDIFFNEFPIRDRINEEALEIIERKISYFWKGIMNNPDAVQGKKKKPKYKERPIKHAKNIIAAKKI